MSPIEQVEEFLWRLKKSASPRSGSLTKSGVMELVSLMGGFSAGCRTKADAVRWIEKKFKAGSPPRSSEAFCEALVSILLETDLVKAVGGVLVCSSFQGSIVTVRMPSATPTSGASFEEVIRKRMEQMSVSRSSTPQPGSAPSSPMQSETFAPVHSQSRRPSVPSSPRE
ncbi:hypothetical protein KIPB_007309 [Kipferlia bialata]|uniref:Uncharacterized protein n=1 Tax=Kipferlia bialata TaxID=797122 RepID=A0A9K3CZU6_9EUKA|nr:hypothetical protein KIPB_007309 [Kipferlia bialata]|eukprot:g7309.t1